MAGPVLGPSTRTMVVKPAAGGSDVTRSMTASPREPTGANGLQPPYRLARPAARITNGRPVPPEPVLTSRPAIDGACPGHASTESGHEDVGALVPPAALNGVMEGQRDRGGGRVPVAVDHDHGPLDRDPESLADRLDDPDVRLVGHHEGDVVRPEPGIGHGPLGGLDDHSHGPAEDLLAVHEEGPAVLALEQVARRAVGVQVPAQQPTGSVDRLDDHGAGAVADDDGDLPVVHVGDLRERL